MDLQTLTNDPESIVEADRAHVWHHLIQHAPFETVDPKIIVEGKGIRVWDQVGKEHIDAVSGGVWAHPEGPAAAVAAFNKAIMTANT